MLHFHSGRYVDKRSAAKYSRIERAKFVVSDWNNFAEPFSENFRIILQPLARADKDNALLADSFLDVRINSLAVELRFHAGEELAFLLRNAKPLECPFNIVGHFLPTALRFGAGREIITDLIEINRFQFLASPMCRKRLFQKCLQSAQTILTHPVRIAFHVSDVMDSLLAEADPRIAHVRFGIKEIAFASVNVDSCCVGFHLVTSYMLAQTRLPAPNRSPFLPARERVLCAHSLRFALLP